MIGECELMSYGNIGQLELQRFMRLLRKPFCASDGVRVQLLGDF